VPFLPLDPESGTGKKSGSGSGMNNLDHISESLETIFWVKILKFFDVDPGSGMEKIRIREKTSRSATLERTIVQRYTHKTSGFKTSGFKTSGFKKSGLQNVRFSKCQVLKRLVSKRPVLNLIYLLN
jgi:hypothetical protein